MATGAFAGRAAIRHDTSAVDFAMFVVTEAAGDILMRPGQRKRARLVVIEQRGGPTRRIMASRAVHRLRSLLELAGVNIFVTPHAFFGRRCERNRAQL